MNIGWSQVQLRRLKDLDAGSEDIDSTFDSLEQRDRSFQKLEDRLVKIRRTVIYLNGERLNI